MEEPSSVKNKEPNQPKVEIYPNPTDGHITIAQQDWKAFDTAALYDPLGKRVFSSHLDELVQTLTLPVLPAGAYLLKLTGENALHSEKVFVQLH